MKIALIHDYLVHVRGGERVLCLLASLFPDADIYMLVRDPTVMPVELQGRRIHTSFIQRIPQAARRFRWFFPLYPYAVERFNLDQYDLVISTSSGYAHGVITMPHTCHICYSLSPFRYAWSGFHELIVGQGDLKSLLTGAMLHSIRQWDHQAAERVDYYAAISQVTQQRIQKFYHREATVIYPPIQVADFSVSTALEDYFLVVSSLVPYKRVDIAVEAFNRLGLPLRVIGEGPELRRLRNVARPNVEFLGALPDDVVRQYYARCQAFIFTAEEDYGLTPLEAQASGRPVIAYGAGGALETVVDEVTGVFYSEQTADSLAEAVSHFEPRRFDPQIVRSHADRFDLSQFETKMRAFIHQSLIEYRNKFGLASVLD